MRTRTVVAALIFVLGGIVCASAQVLSLEFNEGRVRLTAENVPASEILAEWSRRGGTTIVNGERVPGAPLTLQLEDVAERQALEVVLRGAAGYMVLARAATTPGMSTLDKVMVLPTSSRPPAPNAVAPSPPQAPQPGVPLPERDEPAEVLEDQQVEPPQAPLGPPAGFPRGRIPQGLNLPNSAPAPNQVPPETDATAPGPPPTPRPANPFGILPGSDRPGVVNPPPLPRDPNEAPRP